MGYVLKTNLANRKNYGNARQTGSIKYIVIHYTANDGDSDEGNANYFKSPRGASAHYFVDDDSVTQSVPDNYIAYSVGGSKYKTCTQTGGGKYYAKAKNANTINIELCDTVKNGNIAPTQKTIENALALTKTLMKKYNISADNVIRHFDVTGKGCPAYWCATAANNTKWLTEFKNRLNEVRNVTELTTVNDIVWELAERGVISDKQLWLKKLEEDQNAYWLARKALHYIRSNV